MLSMGQRWPRKGPGRAGCQRDVGCADEPLTPHPGLALWAWARGREVGGGRGRLPGQPRVSPNRAAGPGRAREAAAAGPGRAGSGGSGLRGLG